MIKRVMDDDDRSWLDALASFDTSDSAVDLLDGLVHTASDAPSVVSTPTAVVASEHHKKKRSRVTTWRAHDEIRRLQQSAQELEDALVLLQRSHRLQEARHTGSADELERTRVWRGVAMRQLQYLRQSQVENEHLRREINRQRALLGDLARLWRRASVGLQTVALPRRPLLPDPVLIQRTRHELLTRALRVYQGADQRTVDSWLNAAELVTGKRETIVHRHPKYVIPSGSILVTSRLGLLVPAPTEALKTRLWGQEGSQPPPNTIEHVERTPQYYFLYHSYQLKLSHEAAVFHSALVRRCFQDGPRHVITLVGALWPLEAASQRGNSIDFELSATAVVQPAADASLTEVRVHIHSVRRDEAVVPAEMDKGEAMMLLSFVASAHNFLLDSLERDIDIALLSRLTG